MTWKKLKTNRSLGNYLAAKLQFYGLLNENNREVKKSLSLYENIFLQSAGNKMYPEMMVTMNINIAIAIEPILIKSFVSRLRLDHEFRVVKGNAIKKVNLHLSKNKQLK